ncbi:MAG TPA: alpha/beta fold hydrolase [Mycobacteriales bacterium]|nr:alpha/beta fold hydrolase [Mycobacteriales bacterium]
MTAISPGPTWVRVTRPRPAARLNLICLPFAGGGASRYRDWPDQLPENIAVVPVQLPGREDRLLEPVVDSMEPLVSRLLAGLAGQLDRPVALFGHSMGALIAFELATRLRVLGHEPVHVFVSGCRAPYLPRRSADRHMLPDPEFIASVRELNGIPPELADNADFLDLVLPTLRGDFTLVETYRYRDQPPLRCPVSVLGGLGDSEVSQADLAAWSRHTTGPCQVHLLPGDHFFVDTARPALLRLVSAKLGG